MKEPRIYYLLTGILSLIFGWVTFYCDYSFLSLFEDDFYYYAEIAKNIANTGVSTFDGDTLTNGYHPMWLMILLILQYLFGGEARDFLFSVYCVGAFFSILSGVLAKRLYIELGGGQIYANAIAYMYFFLAFYLSVRGMEVALVLAMLPTFVMCYLSYRRNPTSGHSFVLGICISLLVLSRLDTAIYVALVGGGYFASQLKDNLKGIKGLLGNALWVLLGMAPLGSYFLFNYVVFESMMPLSGEAKALKSSALPSVRPWLSLVDVSTTMSIFVPGLIVFTTALALFGGLVVRRLSDAKGNILLLSLSFPFVYVFVMSLRSDWQLWIWYFYPFVFSQIFVCFLLFESSFFSSKWMGRAVVCVSALVAVLLPGIWVAKSVARGETNLVSTAKAIQAFSKQHPGRYAMGDRAGLVAYLLQDPLVQLEGLVQDKEFIHNIRMERDLVDVLHHYSVDYYIATNPEAVESGWRGVEPYRAGKDSPKMRGTFNNPVFYRIDGKWRTYIFKLGSSR